MSFLLDAEQLIGETLFGWANRANCLSCPQIAGCPGLCKPLICLLENVVIATMLRQIWSGFSEKFPQKWNRFAALFIPYFPPLTLTFLRHQFPPLPSITSTREQGTVFKKRE